MVAQTTYNDTPAVGFNGMLAEQFSLRQVDSGLADSVVALGSPVIASVAGTKVTYGPAEADDDPVAVAIYASAKETIDSTFQYEEKEMMPLLRLGRYYAVANAALALGSEVGYDPATGKVGAVSAGVTTTALGKTTTVAAADGDLVIIQIDLL
jgi:hypothetical protein